MRAQGGVLWRELNRETHCMDSRHRRRRPGARESPADTRRRSWLVMPSTVSRRQLRGADVVIGRQRGARSATKPRSLLAIRGAEETWHRNVAESPCIGRDDNHRAVWGPSAARARVRSAPLRDTCARGRTRRCCRRTATAPDGSTQGAVLWEPLWLAGERRQHFGR